MLPQNCAKITLKSSEWQKLNFFCEEVRSNKTSTIVNIGIGIGLGLDGYNALKPFQVNQNIRFVSNVDPADFE